MQQFGFKVNSSSKIDDLAYTYKTNSNQLLKVVDGSNDVNSKMGDFKEPSASGNDYVYDVNGNLTSDANKGISSILYNHLNQPYQVTITGKGTINYTFDNLGKKHKKVVVDNTVVPAKTTTWLYTDNWVYRNDTLEYFTHEEGRARPVETSAYVNFNYDYFLKDHLGNVRLVLTEKKDTVPYYTLSFEGTTGSPEQQNQDAVWENKTGGSINIVSSRTARPGSFGTSGSNGSYVLLARKSTGAIGAAKLLKVMRGDRIHTMVDCFYTVANANNSGANGINSLVANIATAIAASMQIAPTLKTGASLLATDISGNTGLASLLNTPNNVSGPNNAPKAYLNVLFFDEQFRPDNASSRVFAIPYGPNVKTTIDRSGINAISVGKNGYLYLYVSNESDEMVYFDNFVLTHEIGPLREETHYYPFGLTMAGISSRALLKTENKNKFNKGSELENKEFSDGSGLELYSTNYRGLDPQIGRFLQPDPLSNLAFHYSIYSYASNNPISLNDPLGLLSTPDNPEVLPEVVVTPNTNRIQSFSWFGWSGTVDRNFNRSLNTYSQRRKSGVTPVQDKDPAWYKASVSENNMETWHQGRLTGKQFEQQFYLMYFSAFGLPFLAPEIAAAAPELIATKAVISAGSQAVINGPSNINVAGVISDAFLSPGSSALVNGAMSWRPFSEAPNGTFSIIGNNKSFMQAGIDFSASLLGGSINARLGTTLSPLNGALESNLVEFSIGTPTAFAQEIGGYILNKKLSTQK